MTSGPDRTDEIFAARCILEDGIRSRPVFGIKEIVAFLDDPGVQFTPEQTRLLFTDAKLRDAFRQLKTRVAIFALPVAAAASGESIVERDFDGGRARLCPSSMPGQSYLIIRYNDLSNNSSSPSMLEITGLDTIKKVSLHPADDERESWKDLDDEEDRDFIRLFKNPLSSGTFL